MSERAKAAYAAYGEVVGWKNFRGDPMPQFDALSEAIQQAWDGACEGALRYWMENEFRNAVNDDDRVDKYAAMMIKIGHERGDDPLMCIRAAIASFVIDCIAPELLTPLED